MRDWAVFLWMEIASFSGLKTLSEWLQMDVPTTIDQIGLYRPMFSLSNMQE